MLVVNIKRTVDMSPLKRIRLRSHAASEFEGERIDACSRAARACWYSPNFRLEKSIFVLSLVLPGGPPQALVPVGALSDHGLVYFIFHCNNHVTSFFTRHWELRFDVAPELGLLRGLSCGVRSFDEESGSLAMRSVQYRRVLPQWRCSIERIPPERTEGYCHSGSAVSRGYRRDVWRDQFLRRAQG